MMTPNHLRAALQKTTEDARSRQQIPSGTRCACPSKFERFRSVPLQLAQPSSGWRFATLTVICQSRQQNSLPSSACLATTYSISSYPEPARSSALPASAA